RGGRGEVGRPASAGPGRPDRRCGGFAGPGHCQRGSYPAWLLSTAAKRSVPWRSHAGLPCDRGAPAAGPPHSTVRAGPSTVDRSDGVSSSVPAVPDPERSAVQPEPAAGPVLPEPVRQRVLALAADTLGRLPPDEVPAALRAAARFTPAKPARLASSGLAVALESEPLFRLRVAEAAELRQPAAAEAVRHAESPAAADPVELAVLAYLLRPEGWSAYLERAGHALAERAERSRAAARDEVVGKLQTHVDEGREALAEQGERAAAELATVQSEAEALRRQVRQLTGRMRAAERAAAAADEALAEERRRTATTDSAAQAELRRLKAKLAESEDVAEGARRAARESRNADEARLWLPPRTGSAPLPRP